MTQSDPTRRIADSTAREHFDRIWEKGDFWQLESSEFERQKYQLEIEFITDRRYGRALEIGCGAGAFTRLLAPHVDRLLALDVSDAALARAAETEWPPAVEFRHANVMEFDLASNSPLDLVVINETIYYLGWLYSFFDVSWFATCLHEACSPSGRLLMANTFGNLEYLVRPQVIRTYRDLFVNVGFDLARETVYTGVKDETSIDVLISLFEKR